MADWIKFVEVNLRDGRKTRVWAVLTSDGKSNLGDVSWYSPWRKYSFFPNKAVFEHVCLRTIADFCEDQTRLHKLHGKAFHHLDGNPLNNQAENLRIVNVKERSQ